MQNAFSEESLKYISETLDSTGWTHLPFSCSVSSQELSVVEEYGQGICIGFCQGQYVCTHQHERSTETEDLRNEKEAVCKYLSYCGSLAMRHGYYADLAYPPRVLWEDSDPQFAQNVLLVNGSREGFEHRFSAVFKYQEHWFVHQESVWRFGGGGDCGYYDSFLPGVFDETILEYMEILRNEENRYFVK